MLARRRLIGILSLAFVPSFMATPVLAAAVSDRIIVSGASGQLGQLTVEELLRRGVDPKNLILVSRTPAKLEEYAKKGASVRYGDLYEPKSLASAYAGGTRMLLISIIPMPGAVPRSEAHKAAIDAAVRAGVKHIVYTSFIAADQKSASPIGDDHRKTEISLKASGVKWTVLRNGYYDDVFVAAAVKMAKTGRAVMRTGEQPFAPVTHLDCAAAAAAALLNPRLSENKTFVLTGSESWSARDMAEAVGRMTGRAIEVVEQANDGDLPPDGAGGPVTDDVAKLAGRPATGLRASLEANRKQIMEAALERAK
jgi:NAD(P)H dehydrogenase (quinone)